MSQTTSEEVGIADRYSFSSASPEGKRWMWHPSVHQAFGEYCFFFLVRLARSDIHETQRHLRALVADAGVQGASIYPLLGYHDGLIRFWATEERRRQFLLACQQAGSSIDLLDEFRADVAADQGISYLWWPTSGDALASDLVDRNRSTIELIARADLAGQLTDDEGHQRALRLLERQGLVKLHDPAPSGADFLKTYVVLDSQAVHQRSQVPDLVRGITEHLSKGGSSLDCVSLYRGVGFGRLLVKGIVPSFRDLVEECGRLGDIAFSVNFRSMTLILADYGGESDSLGPSFDELGYGVARLVGAISERLALTRGDQDVLRARMQAMRGVDRESYAQVFNDFPEVFGERHESDVFFRLLYALIGDDVEEFGDALVFLQKTEGLLRRYLRRVWTDALGSDWVAEVNKFIPEPKGSAQLDDPDSELQGPRSWTLRTLVEISKQIAQRAENDGQAAAITERVDGALGNRWRGALGGIVGLRNDHAHGRTYEYDSLARFYPAVEGQDRSGGLRRILEAGEVFLHLNEIAT